MPKLVDKQVRLDNYNKHLADSTLKAIDLYTDKNGQTIVITKCKSCNRLSKHYVSAILGGVKCSPCIKEERLNKFKTLIEKENLELLSLYNKGYQIHAIVQCKKCSKIYKFNTIYKKKVVSCKVCKPNNTSPSGYIEV